MRHAEAEIAYRGIDISGIDDFGGPATLGKQQAREICRGPAMRPNGRLFDRQRHIQRPARPPPADWESYMKSILADMRACSRIGFAINFMLPHDDKPTEDELYRSTPATLGRLLQEGTRLQRPRAQGLRTARIHAAHPQETADGCAAASRVS